MLVYIFKSTAILALLLLFYKSILEKENMHTFKRFYLLGAVVSALLIPFITFVEYVDIIPVVPEFTQVTSQLIIEQPVAVNIVETFNVFDYLPYGLWSLYILGLLFFGYKFTRNLYDIVLKIRKNPKYRINQITNVLLSQNVTPHTFFSFIFLNKNKFESKQIPYEVLLHEETHAKQKHSIDVLLIEFIQVLFWFNPLFYLLKKAIKLNHEFLADRAVINNGIQPKVYQQLLLEFSSNPQEPSLANAINYSSIKKRFTLMKTQTSKQSIFIRSLLLLPMLTLLIYGFAETRVEVNKTQSNHELLQETSEIGAPEKMMEDLTPFVVSVQKNKNSIRLKCNTGCKWADITLDTKAKSKYIINDYGFSEGKTLKTDKFAFSIEPSASGVSLTNLKGAAWLDLNFSLTKNQEQFINENGMLTLKNNKSKKNKTQDGATNTQVKEYNALALKYNRELSKEKSIQILKSDVKRLEQLHGLMTHEQRENAQPFPDFPEPPPVSTITSVAPVPPVIMENSHMPPPPPIPPNATKEQRVKYEKAIRNYEKGNPGIVSETTINGKRVKSVRIVEDNEAIPPAPPRVPKVLKGEKSTIPPPPLPPKSPLDHVVDMAKKDAVFYFDGKKISSDKAIAILKKNKSINIRTKHEGQNNPTVELLNKPIVIKK